MSSASLADVRREEALLLASQVFVKKVVLESPAAAAELGWGERSLVSVLNGEC